jgi:phytoene dehydrogenase-like protein
MKRLFRGLRRPPDAAYDVVVIGSGIGGLIAGNLLAKDGARVLLVEQHYMAGGYCSTFRRGGYTFDAATHFYPLLGNPETLTGKLLAELGVETGWVKMDPVDTFHFPDGSRFAVPAAFDSYLARLKAEFPHEAAALDGFFAEVRDTYLLGLLCYFRGRAVPKLAPYVDLTVRQALERHFRDRKLRLLLTADCPHWGSPPGRTSFVFDSMLRLSYFLGNYYPRGGSQAFADELARRFEEQGGHILMSTAARRILVEGGEGAEGGEGSRGADGGHGANGGHGGNGGNGSPGGHGSDGARRRGAARGVELETLRGPAAGCHRVRCGAVISNADLLQTWEQLVPPERVPPGYLAGLRRLRPTFPCFLIHMGLTGVAAAALEEVQGYYWDSWDMDRVGVDALRFKLFAPTLYEPAMAPPGGQVLIVQKVLEMDYAATDSAGAIAGWQRHKQEIESFVLSHLERLLPGIGTRIAVRSSASAHTSWRFTLNYEGAMLGWEMSPEQLGAGRPDLTGPIDDLYTVGHWTRPGGGITPVIVSAQLVAKAVAAGGGGRAGWIAHAHDADDARGRREPAAGRVAEAAGSQPPPLAAAASAVAAATAATGGWPGE